MNVRKVHRNRDRSGSEGCQDHDQSESVHTGGARAIARFQPARKIGSRERPLERQQAPGCLCTDFGR